MDTMDGNLDGHEGEEVNDEMILARLRMAAEVCEPVPTEVLQAARDAFAWRLIDAELAELVADSALELAYAGTRGGWEPRIVTFEVPGGIALELEACCDGRAVHLVGQVTPARAGTAEVQHSGGNIAVPVDGVGRFAARGICRGPMRVRLRFTAPGEMDQPPLDIVTASLTL